MKKRKDVLTLEMIEQAKEKLKEPIDLTYDPHRLAYYNWLKSHPKNNEKDNE